MKISWMNFRLKVVLTMSLSTVKYYSITYLESNNIYIIISISNFTITVSDVMESDYVTFKEITYLSQPDLEIFSGT